MDTPAKSHALSASASNYEDSPVFHYINNLSPLELVKSSGTNQPFNVLSSASPLPVFTSPQIDTNKEHLKFQGRGLQLSGSLVLEFPENENKDSPRLGVLKSSEELHALDGKSAFKSVVSAEHNAILPTEHNAANQVAINTAIMHEQEYASSVEPSVPFMDGYERNIHKICHSEQSMQDSLTMVPATDSDVINFKSSNLHGSERIDPGSVVSTADIVQYPKGSTIEEPKLDYAGLVSSSADSELEQKLATSDPVLSHVTLHELGISDSNGDMDESNEFVTASYRQSTLLRRCLFSEMATTNYNSMGTSMSISDIREVIKWDSEASNMPLLNTTLCGAASASDYLVSGDASPKSSPDVNRAISLGRDLIAYDNEVHKTEDDCHTSAPVRKQFDQHSPLLKRSRLEQDMEITSCKRCNCRRSKCLKLYCECFAAGLYCIEPCSCQDCFNRPIFKDKVLETRTLIESRNPLAFVPKVIRGTDSYMEHVEEGTKTPASARHKQGCRCKRSSCLKKYCECFQVGVGCSFNCRCEGCKNTYGRKDELEGRDTETCQRVRSSHVTAKYDDNEEEEHADPRKRGAAHDARIQSEMPFILPKSHTGTFRSNGGAPRACSSTKLDTLCTFLGKHTLEKQDEMTLDAENRDVNQERLSTKCSPPGSLKHSSPRGKGVPHSLYWVRSLSSTAMRSSRRRVILKSITSFGKTLTESAGSSNRSADPENT